MKYETQHGIWNYCAPTNLSMALTFWASNKRVANRRLTGELGVRLAYPTYREGYAAILEGQR